MEFPNFTRVEKKKQHLKREKEKEDRRDVFFLYLLLYSYLFRDVLEQKYDELKASCDKMEVILKQLAVAQTKKNDKMDLILTKLMSSQLSIENGLKEVDMNYRPEADLDERF